MAEKSGRINFLTNLKSEEEQELCLQGVEQNQPIQRECASYVMLSNAPPSVDQLAYWLAHKEQFPILFHLAAVSAASSNSECVFTAAGHTVTPKRANLNPDKLMECAIVRCNLRLLKSMGLRH